MTFEDEDFFYLEPQMDPKTALRKHCVEEAVKHHHAGTPPEVLLKTAKAFYDFIADKPAAPNKPKRSRRG